MPVKILSIQGHWVLVAVLLGCGVASLPLFRCTCCSASQFAIARGSILGALCYGRRCLRCWDFVLWLMWFMGWTFAELCSSSQLPALGHPSLTVPAVLLRYKTLEVVVCCRACYCWGGIDSGANICHPQPIVFCCHASLVSLHKSKRKLGMEILSC